MNNTFPLRAILASCCICITHAIVTLPLPHTRACHPRQWWGHPTYTGLHDSTPPDRYRLACRDCSASTATTPGQTDNTTDFPILNISYLYWCRWHS